VTIDFSQYSRIPSLPTVAVEALKLFHDSNSSNEQLVSVIRKDPAIVQKLLKAANSAKYGIRGEITDLNRAVMIMGRSAAAPLVLSFSLAKQSMEVSAHQTHYKKFWTRSFVQATASEVIAAHFGSSAFRAECYTTNILAGLGKLALLRAEPDKYMSCLTRSVSEGIPLPRVEQEVFGFNHSRLSSILLQQMGLPDRCLAAIRGINDTQITEAKPTNSDHPLLQVTRLANAVATLLCDETPWIALVELEEALAAINLPTQMNAQLIIESVRDHLEASAPLFDISPSQLPSASDLLQEALDQLSRLVDMASESNPTHLVPVELLEENGRLKRRVADLLHVSRIDSLTGLCNRAHLLQELAERAALHRVRGLSLGIAVIDIDHFKKINDTFGHQAGDAALKAVAATLRDALRETDIVGRYGGEEFAAILEDSNAAGLAVVGERLRSKVEKTVVTFEGRTIPITISVGLVEGAVTGPEQKFGDVLFAAADAAMYRAKNSGRNCFVVDSILQDQNGVRSLERSRSKPHPTPAMY